MSRLNTTLGPHVDLISGAAFKSRFFTDDSSDVPLVKGENLGQGMIIWEKSRYWPRADSDDYEKFALIPGDVVVAMDRPWVSAGLKYAVINERDPKALLVQRVARIRGANGLTSQYLRYVIASPEFCAYVKNIMDGTSVPHISGNQIRAFPFRLPPKKDQQRIAGTLSAYDDLIENNRRRIRLLEQTARTLYNEWFVHLRYPGHKRVTITDGVPEGWERKTVPEIIEFNPKEEILRDLSIRYIPMAGLSTSGMTVDLTDSQTRTKSTSVRFRNGDTLLARITPCLENGKTGFVNFLRDGEVACGSTEFIVLRGRLVSSFFTYCLARTYDFRQTAIKSMIGSSGRQRVQPSCFDDFMVVRPCRSFRDEFDNICDPIFSQIAGLTSEIYSLTRARDLVLPRLMNGKIAV